MDNEQSQFWFWERTELGNTIHSNMIGVGKVNHTNIKCAYQQNVAFGLRKYP